MAKRTYIPKAYDEALDLKNYIDRWSVTMKDNMDNGGAEELDALRAAIIPFLEIMRQYVDLNP
jgi:hypothetical protein